MNANPVKRTVLAYPLKSEWRFRSPGWVSIRVIRQGRAGCNEFGLVAARPSDCAAVFLQTKTVAIQICSIGLVQWMGLARCQCGQTRPLALSFFLCCRFCIPVETGAPKGPVAWTKPFRRVLRGWQRSLKLCTLSVHTESHVVAEKISMSLGHSGFDFQQTDSVQGIDRRVLQSNRMTFRFGVVFSVLSTCCRPTNSFGKNGITRAVG